jgi:hypothetical protein
MIRHAGRKRRCLASIEEVGKIFDRYTLIGNVVCRLRSRHACERRHGNASVGMVGH